MKTPKIPATVFSVLGPVPVTRVESLPDREGKPTEDLGEWDGKLRRIAVRSDMAPVAALQTLYHEKVHMWLWDAGVDLPEQYVEGVCDVIGSALAAEKLNE